ncbi:MAG: hypothetical protein AB1898_24185 [Acidobacteriota bacterium]
MSWRHVFSLPFFTLISAICLATGSPLLTRGFGGPTLSIDTPMSPPEWALLERAVLNANSRAVEAFASKYLDSRGYLLHTPRWGTLDGPDDAIETFYNWTLLHALGGSQSVLDLYKKGLEGHLLQYKALRTKKTELAAEGAYHKEFITMSDWFHTAEGMRAFFLWGLSEPTEPLLVQRMKRFAGLYLNEDPEAANYDPEKKIIKSLWNGSKGPMMRKATVYDWVGDPVPGTFHLLHNPAGASKMLNLLEWYPRMLAHCDEYLDSVGDTFLNLAASLLGFNAYALTQERKYRDWTLEYVNAWRERTKKTGGMIPSNVGLNGEPGGEYDGQWWKGTYGWNFTIFDGELQQIAHRNYFSAASWPAFSIALLLTGDQSYIDVLRTQMDLLYQHKRVENGRILLPQMYGDPRGYRHKGKPEFYHYTANLFVDRLTEIYLWSMRRQDLDRIPVQTDWVSFLEGHRPDYPVKALREDLDHVRSRMERVRSDPTSPETRLADYLLLLVPATTDHLLQLTTGGYLASGRIWVLHSRLRYFDPERRRSGLPADVAALVQRLSADSVTVTLVNVNSVEPRSLQVQAGTYGEHQFTSVTWDGQRTALNESVIDIRLAPGAGSQLTFSMNRYVNVPSLAQPWNRGGSETKAE